MLGAGASVAVVMSAYSYSKGLTGHTGAHLEDDDEVDRKEALKKLRRRPLSETIEELGEGRGRFQAHLANQLELILIGIYAPGYEERRRQRLLQKYGIDVGETQGTKSTTNTYL